MTTSDSLEPLTMSSCCKRTSNAEKLWQAANVDIKAIEIIISSHFRTSLSHHARMDDGAFARVFLFTLENGMQVIARIILPVRESVKTEADVAAMELVRGHYRWSLLCYCDAHHTFYPCPNIVVRTSIPVPKVYLYCSTLKNPVRAEWILMEYMPGLCLADGFEQLPYEQKRRTASLPLMWRRSCFLCLTSPWPSAAVSLRTLGTGAMKAFATTPFAIRSLPHSFPRGSVLPSTVNLSLSVPSMT